MTAVGAEASAGRGPADTARLLVVALGAGLADEAVRVLSPQAPITGVELVTGFYAAVAAIDHGRAVLVIDLGSEVTDRDLWLLAGLRARAGDATVVALADDGRLAPLAGTLHADLAVSSTGALPPLRELVDGAAPSGASGAAPVRI